MSMQAAEWLPSGVTIAACCSAAHLAVTSAQQLINTGYNAGRGSTAVVKCFWR